MATHIAILTDVGGGGGGGGGCGTYKFNHILAYTYHIHVLTN